MPQPIPFPRAGHVQAAPKSGPAGRYRESFRELRRRLAALEKDRADLHRAVVEAEQVHRRLCAPRIVRRGGFEIASEIFAMRYLPGDFFTVEEAGDGRVILALGDVCGKGMAAGMWTPCLVGLVRAHAATCSEPEVMASRINREVCRIHAPLTSLFLARLDPATGAMDYCRAGHPPALLLRADGRLESLVDGGVLLGVVPDVTFRQGRVDMNAGDVLLACSDGVFESCNDRDEEFGYVRLEAHLRLARNGSAQAALFSVLAAVQDFAAPHASIDDMTLVVISRSDDADRSS